MRLLLLVPKTLEFPGGDMVAVKRSIECYRALGHEVATIEMGSPPAVDHSGIPRRFVSKGPRLSARTLAAPVLGRSLIFARFQDPAFARAATEEAERTRPDVVIAEHAYLGDVAQATGFPWAVTAHVLEHCVATTSASSPLGRREQRALEREEIAVLQKCPAPNVYARDEATYLSKRGIEASFIPFTVPASEPLPLPSGPPRALFVGSRGWSPNREAVEDLRRLWPQVRQRVPEAELDVVGAGWQPEPLRDGVRLRGHVGDIRDAYADADVLVAPLGTGGGVRIKILEAAAAGLPVVTTTVGAGSLTEYLDPLDVHDRDDDLAASVAARLADRSAARRRGAELRASLIRATEDRLMENALASWLERAC